MLIKPWNLYIFRHSALTEKSQILKEHVLRNYAGWTMSSKMPQVYLHYFGNESVNSLLEARGIIRKDDKDNKLNIIKTRICINCSEPNKPDGKFCIKCKMVLTFDSYRETLEKQKEKEDQIKILTLRIDQYEEAQKEGRIMSREHAQKFADIYDKLNALMKQKEEERRRSRDYEMETNFIDKDNKFNIMLLTSEKTIQKQNELERTLEKTLLQQKEQQQRTKKITK